MVKDSSYRKIVMIKLNKFIYRVIRTGSLSWSGFAFHFPIKQIDTIKQGLKIFYV